MIVTTTNLRTDAPIYLSGTDSEPTVDVDGGAIAVGRELIRDTGAHKFWDGSAWRPVTDSQKLCQVADLLIEIRDLLSPG